MTNQESKQQVSETKKSLIECVWEKVKLELDRNLEISITYQELSYLCMCVSGLREITIKNPYTAEDRVSYQQNLIADKFKALLKQKYPESSEWEIKWVRAEWDNHSQTVKR